MVSKRQLFNAILSAKHDECGDGTKGVGDNFAD
jgi:hypothetical protein